MQTHSKRIINEKLSKSQYSTRRAAYLDTLESSGSTHAVANMANKIFPDANKEFTFMEMRVREATFTDITISTALDFNGIVGKPHPSKPGQTLYSKSDWMEARYKALLREQNLRQVVRDVEIVFGNDESLTALEILSREITAEFTSLLPLPTTGNVQTVDESAGTGEILPLSAVSEIFCLSHE